MMKLPSRISRKVTDNTERPNGWLKSGQKSFTQQIHLKLGGSWISLISNVAGELSVVRRLCLSQVQGSFRS